MSRAKKLKEINAKFQDAVDNVKRILDRGLAEGEISQDKYDLEIRDLEKQTKEYAAENRYGTRMQ